MNSFILGFLEELNIDLVFQISSFSSRFHFYFQENSCEAENGGRGGEEKTEDVTAEWRRRNGHHAGGCEELGLMISQLVEGRSGAVLPSFVFPSCRVERR